MYCDLKLQRPDIDPILITTLELDSCGLLNFDNLPSKLDSLRWASFRNNYIQDVTKLGNYLKLEELSLEKNTITELEPLTKLPMLTKLDVSHNKLSSFENIMFKNLLFLNLEDNQIKSIKTLSKSISLLELYLGDNLIGNTFSMFPLKELPRLIILDLTGNKVCQGTNFRLFTIFHLPRLKILNGTAISAKDQTQAREIYLGKLTVELLGEKIGHFHFKNITELDLRNCKIREIDCLASGDFRSLRKLNFDNNLLSNIDCFVSLVGLRHLSLNNNRIERLLAIGTPYLNGIEAPKSLNGSIMPYLEELYLGYNLISRISDLTLHRLPQLKILYLQGNKITKVDGLEQMINLFELVLDKNQIKAIDPMSFLSLINLRELHIKFNVTHAGRTD
jgi:Leucine-rich repeat (LRR) protein